MITVIRMYVFICKSHHHRPFLSPLCLVFKTSFVQNLSYKNEFDYTKMNLWVKDIFIWFCFDTEVKANPKMAY